MTGFRVALGGAQERFGIVPDLTCLGKVIGGGLPCAAYGGRRASWNMSHRLDRCIRQARCPVIRWRWRQVSRRLSVSMLPCIPDRTARRGHCLDGMNAAAEKAGVALQTAQAGTMFGFFFSAVPIHSYQDAKAHVNTEQYRRFFHAMLDQGVYLAPSQFEAGFLSIGHTAEVIDRTLEALPAAFAAASGSLAG